MPIDIAKLKMPVLSEAGLQTLELLASDDIDFNSLGDYLAKDPLLSATMLKYANSPLQRREVEVTNVRVAVSVLGLKTCKMAVSYAIMKSYSSPSTPELEKIWSHSVNIATIAKIIATRLFPRLADDIETTALVHDMGAMVLARNFAREYSAILDSSVNEGIPLSQSERETFGFIHDEIILMLAKPLHFPSVTIEALKDFHSGNSIVAIVTDVERHKAVLYLAHYFLAKYDPVGVINELLPCSKDTLMLLLGLTEDSMSDIYDECEMMLNVL